MRKVTVYSTEHCPYCRMAKAFLQKNGVPFESIDVGRDEVQARKMIELSGQRGVPVITIDDEVIIGFDVQRLNELFGMDSEGDTYDVIIVGAGPAGLTAAVYCARKLLKTMIISENIGGQALSSWSIDNYMGYRMITGEDLMKKFEEQVRELHVSLELDRIEAVSRDGAILSLTLQPDVNSPQRRSSLPRETNPVFSDFRKSTISSGKGSPYVPPATGHCTRANG